MATHKSAEKRARQNRKKRSVNTAVKSQVKTREKGVLKAVQEKNPEGARESLAKAVSAIDKAASKGVVHRNTAARKISRLTKKVKSLG